MSDTPQGQTSLLSTLTPNVAGQITCQTLRNIVVSMANTVDGLSGNGSNLTDIDPSQFMNPASGSIVLAPSGLAEIDEPNPNTEILDFNGATQLTVDSNGVTVGTLNATNVFATTLYGNGINVTALNPAFMVNGTFSPVDSHALYNLIVPQNSQSANYTTVQADSGRHILHPSSDTTARTFTIAANSSVPYALGTTLTFINAGSAGTITIAINTDTLILAGSGSTGSRTLAPYGIATAIKITSTSWLINGTNLT